ncbi:hypothetical protein BA20089_00510 [Bifidobacterium asteroides DSM 20089]|uniref:Uncharacterized protein n=1 Tax=Bifidobacterium asteroides DSM 20089 TaxID=1437594 RepID=A0AAD0A8Y4_9BIFI|nr:hypothetical protein BA20089_00510 [Bifidobacterium asteroides DSM 20089]
MNVSIQIRIHIFLDSLAGFSFPGLTDSTDWLSGRSLIITTGIPKALVHGRKDSHGRSVGWSPVQRWKICWSQPAKSSVFTALRPSLGKAAKLNAEGDAAKWIGVHGRANWFQDPDRAIKFLKNLTAQGFRW